MSSPETHIISSNNVAIDISLLYQISGNDETFITTMVQTFLKTMPETIQKIENSIRERDWESTYRSAHFAKSSLSVIKIDEVTEWILQVEVNAKNEINLDELPSLVEKIKQRYLLAEAAIKEKFTYTK